MTSTASLPVRTLDPSAVLAAIPRLVGHPPQESVVLVPMRDGTPTGALRFDLAVGDPARTAQAWIGALGRFGRVERLVIVLYSRRGRTPSAVALVDALSSRADGIGLPVEVLVPSGSLRPVPLSSVPPAVATARHVTAGRLLPDIARGEALAVAAEVDALLDRHPRARLPEALAVDAESLLLRAESGRPWQPRSHALAVLIVCAQRSDWRERVLGLLARPDHVAETSVLELVARAAATAPATERSPLLVLLATLHWWSGLAPSAMILAREAVRLDPHDHHSRLLVAALDRGERWPSAVDGNRAA
ncbi:DUF4192 family protein [Rathayibacter sp. VKM Ac-2804]|uniref:DUF4192 family protein n=1 Tax=Rathayibacter sp. VKM Ac-2804 TaxID=2609257 RepID=UPI00132F36B9|nr:DUF4192 family protein [Rathayibacter sp. VKM Ac-2804]QHF23946.1 DUF4192 family protein [Rathayibacter sp. VKM Ac-2804]